MQEDNISSCIFNVDKSMIGNTFLKKIRWKCILKEFVVLWGAAGDEQHNKFGANYITAR